MMSGFKKHTLRAVFLFLLSVAAAALYFWIYAAVLGFETPKTLILKKINAEWRSRIELLNRQMDFDNEALDNLAARDDDIYRSVFGMNELSPKERNEGFSGANRYVFPEGADNSGILRNSMRKLDVLVKKAYVQSRSFEEVASLAKRADNMASCIPAIPPMSPDRRKYSPSSPFGFRSDPKSGKWKMHSGVDFSMKPGNPIYVTGDGVVEEVSYEFRGYGNSVVVDHGFGYKTRYAHLKIAVVAEGMQLKRGDQIGYSGNSGKSTGPHLHYEVIYKGRQINPANYYDLDMTVEEYASMVRRSEDESDFFVHPMHRTSRKK